MAQKLLLRRILQGIAIFSITTLSLYIYMNRNDIQLGTDKNASKRFTKRSLLHTRKLHEYQKLIFENHERPKDTSYNINISLAESMPLIRTIPDTRTPGCSNISYDVNSLPSVSVIIPFYNEALVMILRTVHSVLERTPEELLEEVILVNDHSSNKDVYARLEEYVKLVSEKVKILKTTERSGLIRARMLGAHMAKGDVIMFQDAHTEANVGWAEPLLKAIKDNPRVIIQPEVDQVESMTLEYIGSGDVVPRGGFSWDLRYVWMQTPIHERIRLVREGRVVGLPAQVLPFRAAALVGCALAVRKDYFMAVGAFDEDMKIWGGENIELALRNWMCGGQVLTHPCSRVGHAFKPFAYSFDGDREKIVQKNLMRIAEVWMDDWKKFFYASTFSWPEKHTYFTEEDLRTLEERKKMKRDMNCRSFEWYMNNIYMDVPTPPMEAEWYGEITNIGTDACLSVFKDGYLGISYFCFFHRVVPEELFYINKNKHLIYHHQNGSSSCTLIDFDTWLIKLIPCHGGQDGAWEQTFDVNVHPLVGQMKVTYTSPNGQQEVRCLTQVTNVTPVHKNEQMPQLMECDDNTKFQQWRWQYHFDFNYSFEPP